MWPNLISDILLDRQFAVASTDDSELLMKRCLELGLKAFGKTSPNPYVGALLVASSGEVLAEGYHKGSGHPHAEKECLSNFFEKFPSGNLKGLTLYCNLEPCCHLNKKTPPCAQFLLEQGIEKIVIAQLDPNPSVNGEGVKLLREAGVEVITGVGEKQAKFLNRIFNKSVVKQRPYITLKWAQSLDGALCLDNNSSQWITDNQARAHAKCERFGYDGIGVGAATVINDNPGLLQVHPSEGDDKRAKRFVFGHRNVNALMSDKDITEYEIFKNGDVHLLQNFFSEGKVGAEAELLRLKKELGIESLFIEGGAKTLSFFLENGLVDECLVYVAPMILGSHRKITYLRPLEKIDECLKFTNIFTQNLGNQIFYRLLLE